MIVQRTLYVKISLTVEELPYLEQFADEIQNQLISNGYDVEVKTHDQQGEEV